MSLRDKSDVLKYIENEKDLSRYKISTLEKLNNLSPAKKRILNIEKEFISLPLESYPFQDVADIAAAISIYRTSRNQFYKSYNIFSPLAYDKEKSFQKVSNKLIFIRRTAHAYMHIHVQESNVVQNSDFYYDLAKRQSIKNGTTIDLEKRSLDKMKLSELRALEPSTLEKKRARLQSSLYSIGKYLDNSSKNIFIDENISTEDMEDLENYLDSVIENLDKNIFRYYNDAIEILPQILSGTMGENNYISKMHSLQNILDFSDTEYYPKPITAPDNFTNNYPLLGNLMYGSKKVVANSFEKDSERNIQNKVFGILIPIPRKGNEKMSLLFSKIILDSHDISFLFTDVISNVKAIHDGKTEYFKAYLMKPFWKLYTLSLQENSARYAVSKLTGLNNEKFKDGSINSKNTLKNLNANLEDFLEISRDSIILTTRTRSEEEGISEIQPMLHARITEIKEDYYNIIDY